MATVTESKARFDELRLSGKVFLSNKTAVVGLAIFLVFIGDAFLVQVAPGVLGVQYPDSVVPPQFTQTNPECVGPHPRLRRSTTSSARSSTGSRGSAFWTCSRS